MPLMPGVKILYNFIPARVFSRKIFLHNPAGNDAINLSMIGAALKPWVGNANPISSFSDRSGIIIFSSLSIC